MPAYTIHSVYQDPLLTNVSVRYSNSELVADQVFPMVTVPKRTGFYFVYDKENLRAPKSTYRADFSRANRAEFSLTKTPFGPLLERSLEIGIPLDEINEQDAPLDLRVDSATTVTEKVMLEKEIHLANYLGNSANLTYSVTKSGTSQWSDYSNSTPFTDIQTYRSAMIGNTVTPNTIVMSQKVWDQLKNHPDLLERVKYSQLASITTGLLATLFEVDNVIIAKAVVNTAVEGQTDSLSYVWGKHAWLMYITPTPGVRQVSAGYHLTLQDGRYIDRWVEQAKKAEFVRFNDYYQTQVVAQEAIYGILSAVA